MFPGIVTVLLPYVAVSTGMFIFHNAWVAILSYHACIVAVMALSGRSFRFRPVLDINRLLMPLVFGLSGGVLMFFFWPTLSVSSNQGFFDSIGITKAAWPLFMVYYVSVNPFLEECFWRGCLGSEKKGLVAVDPSFAGYHVILIAGKMNLFWVAITFVILTLASWYWRQLRRESKSLFVPVLSHAAADLSVIVVIYMFAVQRPGI